MELTDEIDQAYARLTEHEYVLELLTATVLACMPAADAERWLADFTANLDRVTVRENIAVGDIRATRITRDGVEMIEGFAEKVAKRLHAIQQRGAAGKGPG